MFPLPIPPRVNRVVVDTNLALMLAVGHLDPRLLGRASHVKGYSLADYTPLADYVAVFPTRITTPHILTELDHLFRKIDPRAATTLKRLLLQDWQPMVESFSRAPDLVADDSFESLGLADSSILPLSDADTVILTADRPLWGELRRRDKGFVLHFDDLRGAGRAVP